MYVKILLNIIAIAGLVIFQTAFVVNLPGIAGKINAIIIVIVFLAGLGNLRVSLWWAAGAGFLLDLYSFGVFGFNLFVLAGIAVLTDFLQHNFFTNRSLYSFLALAFFACLGYDLAVIFSGILASRQGPFFSGPDAGFLAGEAVRLGVNLSAVIAVFYAVNFTGSKLRPTLFLRRK